MESINNTGKPNLPEKTPSSQPNQQNKIKNNVRRLLSQSNRITKQEISRLAEHNPETDLFKALLLTATTGVGAAYDSVTIEVMNQGADETDGLGQDSDTQNDRRGPVGLGIQVAKNWLSSDKFDENIQWQEAAQNSGYYISGGATGAHYGPNNVGFSSLRALKHLYHIAQEYSSGSRQMETKSLIEGLTELKESLSSINAADNTFLNDQVDLLISKVKTLTKIGTCNDLIDVSNDLQRIAETVVAFSILAGGGDGGTTAFIASIFKTVLATANLHWDNQITKHSDEYNREALEELKVNFEKDATPVVSELFETHSLNELKDTVKAALCNRTLPHIKTEDRLTKLVPSVAKPKITHVDIIEVEHEKGITQNDIEIDFIDSLPVEKTKEDIQESKIELEFDTPQLKQESNYNKYLRLEQSLKSDNKLDKINEKIEKADTQKIFDWTDRLAVYEAVRLLEPEQFETVIENLINCRLSLVTTSGTNLNFISNDNKGINQTTFDKMHDELSLYKPYRNMRLSQKDTKKGLNELKKSVINPTNTELIMGGNQTNRLPQKLKPSPPY